MLLRSAHNSSLWLYYVALRIFFSMVGKSRGSAISLFFCMSMRILERVSLRMHSTAW